LAATNPRLDGGLKLDEAEAMMRVVPLTETKNSCLRVVVLPRLGVATRCRCTGWMLLEVMVETSPPVVRRRRPIHRLSRQRSLAC